MSATRTAVRSRLLERLYRAGVFDRLLRRRPGLTIVQYHGVTATGSEMPLNFRRKHVPLEQFKLQMTWLRQRYEILSLDVALARARGGAPLPDSCAVITFDDGFRNNYTQAYPVLTGLGLPATIFVPTGFVSGHGALWLDRIEYALNSTPVSHLTVDTLGQTIALPAGSEAERVASKRRLKTVLMGARPADAARAVAQLEQRARISLGGDRDEQGDYAPVSWEELAEMQSTGRVGVGSHTVTHPILPRCSPQQLEHELTASKARIERVLGEACTFFCYPNGEFDARVQRAVAEAGYAGAVCSLLGINRRDIDTLALRRLGINGTLSMAEFAALVSGGLLLFARARAALRRP